ncbi:uncharacterized protein LDX57_011117 [Aspergillus melleus]|uniref:uncharacterized protein n=1 Tax=Aspergillus melleus TaxID=138277 RepID=UPI001E8DF5BB|nr:uncharacterized protein LDX57_011117 [Aspergillus melleus]KAH8433483.1 hypothetical protein LDX57_011117 [Aspergillus melleus]
MRPPNHALPIDRKIPSSLPPTPALRRPIPDPLAPTQRHHRRDRRRTQNMPRRRDAQSPGRIDLALLVHDKPDRVLLARTQRVVLICD